MIHICKKNQQIAHIFINDLIQFHCLWHVLNNYVLIIRKSGQAAVVHFIMHLHKQPSHWQDVFHASDTSWQRLGCLYRCTIKYHKAAFTVFQMTNTQLFKTCQRQYKKLKGKAVPLQVWSGPQGTRKLRFPDVMMTAQDCGKVVSLTYRLPLPPGNTPGTHFC